MGPSLVGSSWGLLDFRGREGGLPPLLPVPGSLSHPCHLHPTVPSPSFTLHWSYWDGGKLNIITFPPLCQDSFLTIDDVFHLDAGQVSFFCAPIPSQISQGHAGPSCGLGHPAVVLGALGTSASSSGVQAVLGTWGLVLCLGLLVFLTPSPFCLGCRAMAAMLSVPYCLCRALSGVLCTTVPCHLCHAMPCMLCIYAVSSMLGYLCCATRVIPSLLCWA